MQTMAETEQRKLYNTVNTAVLEALKEETDFDGSKLNEAMNLADTIADDVVGKIYPQKHSPAERVKLVASAIKGYIPDVHDADADELAQRLITIVDYRPA
jgi:hypothetical protein